MLESFLLTIIKPLAFPLYCIGAWTLAGLFFWSIWQATQDGIARLRRLHQIPCDRCAFFTGDYRLKCTVHPTKSLTEEAINCVDYEPTSCPATVYSKWSNKFGWSIPKNSTSCTNNTNQSCLRINSH